MQIVWIGRVRMLVRSDARSRWRPSRGPLRELARTGPVDRHEHEYGVGDYFPAGPRALVCEAAGQLRKFVGLFGPAPRHLTVARSEHEL